MDVNEALQRKIKNGNKYDRYFEKVNCKSSFVGTGNTTYGMQQMQEVSKKYQYQTAEIAKQLRKPTISQTVSSIYEFLYDHLQYQLDGYDQQLRSPACSWQQRSSGIDCKSYSVFASTILLNLGIKHYFRKIKQPGYNPDAWTHVYVIVPNGENYYVIDGTLHKNIEVPYSEKEDLLMETKLNYYALNAPNVNQEQTSLQINDEEKLKGFTIALNALENIGVSPEKTLQISQLVKNAYFKKGSFDFSFGLMNDNILNVDGNHIDLELTNNRLGVTPIPTTIAGIDLSMFTNNTTSQTTAGGGIVGALSTLAVDPSGISAIIGTISSIIPLDQIMANVTNVLKYGLSSWGASTNPDGETKLAQTEIQDLVGIFKQMNDNNTEEIINKVELRSAYISQFYYNMRHFRSWAGSTEAGFQKHYELIEKFRSETLVPIVAKIKSSSYNINETTITSSFVTERGNVPVIAHPDKRFTEVQNYRPFFYTKYKITAPTVTQQPLQPLQYNPDGTINTQAQPTANSNIGKILGIGGAIAMAGFLVVPMLKNGSNNATTNKPKPKRKPQSI